MNINKLKRLFPNASPAFIQANLDAENPRPVAIVECSIVNAPLGTLKSQKGTTAPILVRFTTARKRSIDSDNAAPKWLLDCLRYCKIIPGDEPEKVSVEIRQRKVSKGEAEHTLIEIFEQ